MARKIIWSPSAADDVEAIADYIARDSEAYAAAVVRRFFVAIERLPKFPTLGRKVPEIDDVAVREVLVHNYRIIYRYDERSITIAAVVQGARQLEKALRGRRI